VAEDRLKSARNRKKSKPCREKMMTYRKTYLRWKESVKEEYLLSELESIKNDDAQIRDRFFSDLPFGTAGLRGVL
jgi:phosphoglucomutase